MKFFQPKFGYRPRLTIASVLILICMMFVWNACESDTPAGEVETSATPLTDSTSLPNMESLNNDAEPMDSVEAPVTDSTHPTKP